jgi:hypothetical protein
MGTDTMLACGGGGGLGPSQRNGVGDLSRSKLQELQLAGAVSDGDPKRGDHVLQAVRRDPLD